VIAALELDVDELPIGSFPEKVNVAGANFREFGSEPFGDPVAGEAREETAL
jgi:hypothetical protein